MPDEVRGPRVGGSDRDDGETGDTHEPDETEPFDEVDEQGLESFPASDPPEH